VYSGFVDYINNNPVNAKRIWGKIYSSVGIEENTKRANNNQLLYVYPNPFRSTTRINYILARPGNVLLRIYNVNGQLVKTLVNAQQNPGTYEVIWDGKNDLNVKVNSGVYILHIETDIGTLTRKMVFVD
jgi:flagellar hook assembly protein FlgD